MKRMATDPLTDEMVESYFRDLAKEARASARKASDPSKRQVFEWLGTFYLALARRAA